MKRFYTIWIVCMFSNAYPSQAVHTSSDFSLFKTYSKSISPLKPLEKQSREDPLHTPQAIPSYKTADNNAIIQRAWISSIIIPGLGQIYNKHYWKIPIIFLGFGILSYKIYTEHDDMNTYKRIELQKENYPKENHLFFTTNLYPVSSFTARRIQECKRTRDLFIILTVTWYMLNVLDAYASAHTILMNNLDDIATTGSN